MLSLTKYLIIVLTMTQPTYATLPSSPTVTPEKQQENLSINTHWGITRTHFHKGTHSTSSETFHETWVLYTSGKKVFLRSPRGKVEIKKFKFTNNKDLTLESLRLTQMQLFTLLGLGAEINKEQAVDQAHNDLSIILNYKNGGIGTSKTLSYNLANEEQVQIDFKLDLPPTK